MENRRYELPKIIRFLKEGTAETPKDADIVLSTMHKAKGLEWNRVHIADDVERMSLVQRFDYFDNPDTRTGIRSAYSIKEEDANLLYVTWTRAREAIDTKGFHGIFADQAEQAREYPLTEDIRNIIREQRKNGVFVEKEDLIREERNQAIAREDAAVLEDAARDKIWDKIWAGYGGQDA